MPPPREDPIPSAGARERGERRDGEQHEGNRDHALGGVLDADPVSGNGAYLVMRE